MQLPGVPAAVTLAEALIPKIAGVEDPNNVTREQLATMTTATQVLASTMLLVIWQKFNQLK